MPLDAVAITALTRELQGTLVGARIDKVIVKRKARPEPETETEGEPKV